MGAVAYRLRADLRRRWRAWLGVVAVIGMAGGAVLAVAAAARRTDSAYDRFLLAQRAFDVAVPNDGADPDYTPDLDALQRLPEVAASARAALGYLDLGPGVAFLAPADARLGRTMNRVRILRGRAARADRADEVSVSFPTAERYRLRVGSSIPMFDEEDQADARAAGLLVLDLRVVGIHAAPGQFPPVVPGNPAVQATPALYRVLRKTGQQPESLFVRLRRGAADVPAFRRDARRHHAFVVSQSELGKQARDSMHLQAVALRVLAGLLAAVGLLVTAQLVSRQVFLESLDHPSLAAVGMTRRQLWLASLVRVAGAAAAGALSAVVIAYLASPLSPIGLARIAEPHGGFAFDVHGLLVGAALIVVTTLLLAAIPTYRAARIQADAVAAGRGSRVATTLARGGFPAPAVIGARLALEPGRGRTAVPVRSTVVGAMIGIAALVGSLTFGSSLRHLLRTPTLYGFTWQATITNYGDERFDLARHGEALVRDEPSIAAAAYGDDGPFVVNGSQTGGLAMEVAGGGSFLPVLEGRAPRARGEVALGAETRRSLGVRIGERVRVGIPAGWCEGCSPHSLRVVGTVVVPSTNNSNLGEGVLVTFRGLQALGGGNRPGSEMTAADLFVRFVPGTSARARDAVLRRIRTRYARAAGAVGAEPRAFTLLPNDTPADIVNFGRVEAMPFVLGGLLGAIAAVSLGHLLLSSVRRRRRDLAVLSALGADHQVLRRTVLWQATIVGSVVLLAAVPLGVVLGRWAFAFFADAQGVVSRPVTDPSSVVVVVVATFVLTTVLGVIAARGMRRRSAAITLRSE